MIMQVPTGMIMWYVEAKYLNKYGHLILKDFFYSQLILPEWSQNVSHKSSLQQVLYN